MASNHASENEAKLFTQEGLKKMEEELEYLKTTKREEVAERIKVAISFGDLSENAEYDAAKNEQAFMEGRIMELEGILRSAQVIHEEDIRSDVVTIGSIVKVRDEERKQEMEYTIVGSAEADPMEMKISNESPVGRALFGQSIGSQVKVLIPAGTLSYTILGVRR